MADRGYQLRRGAGAVRGTAALSVLIAAGALLLFPAFLCGCSASTPERTVQDFVAARIAGNDDRAAKLTVEGDLAGFMGGERSLAGTDVSFEVGQAEVDGGRALVTVHFSLHDRVVDVPYACRRVGTRWRVSLEETSRMWLQRSPEGEAPDGASSAQPSAP